MENKPLEFHHICGNCKHYNFEYAFCMGSGEHEIYEEDTCEYWEADDDR